MQKQLIRIAVAGKTETERQCVCVCVASMDKQIYTIENQLAQTIERKYNLHNGWYQCYFCFSSQLNAIVIHLKIGNVREYIHIVRVCISAIVLAVSVGNCSIFKDESLEMGDLTISSQVNAIIHLQNSFAHANM